MKETNTNQLEWGWDDTTHFNGIPCEVFLGADIILDKQGKTTDEFIRSEEFQMLWEKAGIEVHSGGFG